MISNEVSAIREKPSALPIRQISASRLLVFGALGWLLYVAHVAFIPIALALLFALVLLGPVEALHKHRLPRSLSALVILAIALGIIGGSIALLWKPAQHWYAQAPHTIKIIKRKVAPAEKLVNRIDDITNGAGVSGEAILKGVPNTVTAAVSTPATEPGRQSVAFFSSTLGAGVSLITFVMLTLFLLTGGPPMLPPQEVEHRTCRFARPLPLREMACQLQSAGLFIEATGGFKARDSKRYY